MSLSEAAKGEMKGRLAAELAADHKRINDQLDRGVRANHTKGKRSVLSLGGKKYMVLVDSAGKVTPAGKHYYQRTGEPEPTNQIDFRQVVDRRGDTEYIRDRQGAMRKLRTLMPNGEFKYTDLGRSFFKQRQIECILEVPCTMEGPDHPPIDAYLKMDRLEIGKILQSAILPEAQRLEKAKAAVLSHGHRDSDGRLWLWSDSGETWYYDDSRGWRQSFMETTPPTQPGGDPRVRVVLHRPMA